MAHISDPHFSCVEKIRTRDFFTKRLLGFMSWKYKRRNKSNQEILTLLADDLKKTKPDHTVVTGDLTLLALSEEFSLVRNWLKRIGSPENITVIPGNHDMYIKTKWRDTFAKWQEYMEPVNSEQTSRKNSVEEIFPTLQITDKIALIGINTAYPCSIYEATGKIGVEQLNKVETILKQLTDQDLFRVILIHHPPINDVVSWRKRLIDMKPLQNLIHKYGVELVLFGHAHHWLYQTLDTLSGPIPAIGVASASSNTYQNDNRAGYFLYTITHENNSWKLAAQERFFSSQHKSFMNGKLQEFLIPISTRIND